MVNFFAYMSESPESKFMQSAQEQNKRPLYPERPSEGIEDEIARLAQFESGEAKKLELTEEERTEILTLEKKLARSLRLSTESLHYRILFISTTFSLLKVKKI